MSNTIPKSSTLMKPTASSQAKSSKHETKANNNNKNNTNNKNENKIKTQTKSTLMKPTASYSLKNPTPPLPQKQCLHVLPTELILQKTPAGSHARSDDFICPLCHSIVWSEVNHAWSDDPVYQYNDLAWKQRHNL